MADIELRGFSGGDKEPGEDGRGKPIVPRNKFVVFGFFTITLLAFVGKYCLLPHDEFRYFLPAVTYSSLLFISTIIYFLHCLLGLRRWRRQARNSSYRQQIRSSLRNLPKIAMVAGLILLEHLLYRYAGGFALGVELVILKGTLPFMYLVFSLRHSDGFPGYGLSTLGLVATLFGLFFGTAVSIQAFVLAIIINAILVATILRTATILTDSSLFSFLFQLSLILTPAFWGLCGIARDAYWLESFAPKVVSSYLLFNGFFGALQIILAAVLIRNTLPTYHIPMFSLASVTTDLISRFVLHQSLITITTLGLLVTGGCCLTSVLRLSTSKRTTTAPKIVILGISAAFLLHILVFGIYFLAQSHEPILTLIDRASHEFHYYATTSTTPSLEQAVAEYQRRYTRPPPPGFDLWFSFARDRGSLIHEYDQIIEDLKPFWGVEPRVLRERVSRVASNEWNNLALVTVRGHNAEIAVAPQWKWMPEQMIRMINTFAPHLPDMDIVLNENDECRVVIPWQLKGELLQKEDEMRRQKPSEYLNQYPSSDWLGKPFSIGTHLGLRKTESTDFYDLSLQSIWHFTLIGCPPSSPARTPLLSGPHLHSVSYSSQSMASSLRSTRYISDWTRAGDICLQPDLRFMSGFLMSPANFKGTHIAVPIFSQSRIDPFNDILAPSPWYYSGRARYEPEKDYTWKERHDTLFWRGATTNGVSIHGGWKWHLRERFVKVVDKLKGKVDVGFTEIARCRGDDCEKEAEEFSLKLNVQFEEFFKYRFLPDVDGAAFSGRWVAFLKGRGLPFKLAIFREWYDSRLVAWRHFVPLDIRLRERDFRNIVDWFMAEENAPWAKKIADWGREWALKTLRNEDAEVYLFRLLLEYARVMNDDREKLGFVLSSGT